MKRIILLIVLALFTYCGAFAQMQFITPNYVDLSKSQTLDSAYLKVNYKLMHVTDTMKVNKTQVVDSQVLLVANNTSKYFSQYMIDYCLFIKRLLRKGVNDYPINNERGTYGYEIYKDNERSSMLVTDLGSQVTGNFRYHDDLHNFKWEIKSDTMSFMGYSCQKAVTEFRGRKYEAWFTPEIPLNNGPWKFGGLPGLILKVKDLKDYFVFECVGVQKLRKLEPIRFYDLKYTDTTRETLNKQYIRIHEDYVAFQVMNGNKGRYFMTDKNGKDVEVFHQSKQPYNPIELE